MRKWSRPETHTVASLICNDGDNAYTVRVFGVGKHWAWRAYYWWIDLAYRDLIGEGVTRNMDESQAASERCCLSHEEALQRRRRGDRGGA